MVNKKIFQVVCLISILSICLAESSDVKKTEPFSLDLTSVDLDKNGVMDLVTARLVDANNVRKLAHAWFKSSNPYYNKEMTSTHLMDNNGNTKLVVINYLDTEHIDVLILLDDNGDVNAGYRVDKNNRLILIKNEEIRKIYF